MRLPQRSSKAFTLIELIVVIVILGILALIAIPTFSKVIAKSQDESALSSLRAMARNAQALKAMDQAAAWGTIPADSIGEVNVASSAGVQAARLAAVVDDGSKNPLAGQVTYFVKNDGVVLSMLSGSKKICVVGFDSSTMGKGLCQAPAAGATTSLGSSLSSGAGSILPPAPTSGTGGSAGTTTGTIDMNYGTGAFATAAYPSAKSVYPYSAVSSSDGSVYLAGRWTYDVASGNTQDAALWKFTADGELDKSFGNNGLVVDASVSGGADLYQDVKIAPNGNVLALHYVNAGAECRLESYTPAGVLNKSATLASGTSCNRIAVDSKGRVLLADGNFTTGYVKRFNADLTPDTTFGSNGTVAMSGPAGTGGVFAPVVYVDSQDRPLISTNVVPSGGGSFGSTVGRMTTSGAMDTTFNSTGWGTTQYRATSGNALNLFVTDARIIQTVQGTGKSVYAYGPNGGLLTSYGTNGVASPALSFTGNTAFSSTGQAYLSAVTSTSFSITRLTTTGVTDTTFGTNGVATNPMTSTSSFTGLITVGDRLLAYGAQGNSLGIVAIK